MISAFGIVTDEDGVTLQEVETILHDRFRHRGGISNSKKK